MSREWSFTEKSESVTINDLVAVTLKNRAQATYDEMERSLHSPLFLALDRARVKPTRWQLVKWRVSRFGDRVCDSWQVLTGRAEIGGGW